MMISWIEIYCEKIKICELNNSLCVVLYLHHVVDEIYLFKNMLLYISNSLGLLYIHIS